MSSARTVSHPFHMSGPFAIFEKLESIISAGSNYGMFQYESAIPYINTDDGTAQEVIIKASSYASVNQGLSPGQSYILMGRLLAVNDTVTQNYFFNSDSILSIGTTPETPSTHANLMSCYGLGVVKSVKETDCETNSGNPYKELSVVLMHSDWDSNARNIVKFDVTYKVAGRGHLAKTLLLFQVGREILLSGVIGSFNLDDFIWIVNVHSVSVTSGSLPKTPGLSNSIRTEGSGHKRVVLEAQRPQGTPQSTRVANLPLTPSQVGSPICAISSSQGHSKDVSMNIDNHGSNPDIPRRAIEEGKVFENTFPKKRTPKDILHDAGKRMRQP